MIGGGISGLAAALRFRERRPDLEIVLYEKTGRAGGLIHTERTDGFVIEAGADAYINSKPGAVQLTSFLGLDDQVVESRPELKRSFVLLNGQLAQLPTGMSGLVPSELRPLLSSKVISPIGKIRMLADFVIPPRKGTEDESVASFVKRRLGSEVYTHMMEPLLTGIYGGNGEHLSLAATFPQLRTSEITYGGLIRGAIAQRREAATRPDDGRRRGFRSFNNGMQVLVDRAEEVVRASGTEIRYNMACTAITPGAPGFGLQFADTTSDHVHGVVLAVPGWTAPLLLEQVAPEASHTLATFDYGSNALCSMAFRESDLPAPLKGYGYVVPRIEKRHVMAMTWSSSKWPNRAPAGHALIRTYFGRKGFSSSLAMDDRELAEETRRELREVLGITAEPVLTRVARVDRGMPLYTMGHLDRIERIFSSIARSPGLQLAGNMLRGVGVPDCISSGQRAADDVLVDLDAIQAASAP